MNGLDLTRLSDLIERHGPVARVVVAQTQGSTPREAGAAMVVWADGADGTIGGGELEHRATIAARQMLASGGPARLDRLPLGPALGQCCGGAVVLLTERWTRESLSGLGAALHARPMPGTAEGPMPLAIHRMLARARDRGILPLPQSLSGWFIEPLSIPRRDLWVWGAGHVGRALVGVLSPLPDRIITWIDTDAARFPQAVPPGVRQRIAADPGALVAEAPVDADHLIVTYSHALDLDLCHRLLVQGFASLGLIGSASKRARFHSRLAALGHSPIEIARITCPIGDPSFGKDPQAIAIGVAAALLRDEARSGQRGGRTSGEGTGA